MVKQLYQQINCSPKENLFWTGCSCTGPYNLILCWRILFCMVKILVFPSYSTQHFWWRSEIVRSTRIFNQSHNHYVHVPAVRDRRQARYERYLHRHKRPSIRNFVNYLTPHSHTCSMYEETYHGTHNLAPDGVRHQDELTDGQSWRDFDAHSSDTCTSTKELKPMQNSRIT